MSSAYDFSWVFGGGGGRSAMYALKRAGEYAPLWDSSFKVVLLAGGIAVCGESLSAFEVVGKEFEDGGRDGGVE